MDQCEKHILLVEDEAIIAMLEKQELENIGYSVNQVMSGKDAVQQVLEKDIPCDLILMDIDLGSGIDGTEAAEQILKEKDIPIVFLSSHTEPEIVEKTEKITSYGYVVKSSSITVLDASIKMALKLYNAKNEEKQAKEALRESEATIRNKLKVITQPEGDISTLVLADIVDVDELQALMEDFYTLTGIGCGIIETSGNILVACGWQDICTKFHRVHPESCKNCLESDTELSRGVPAGTFKLYRCKNNMWDMATPIMVNKKHIGNIFLGQFLFEDEEPDEEMFRNQARQYGFDETEYLAALNRVPRFTRETIDRVMGFYARLADMISSLSYSKIKLSRNIMRHKRMEDALTEKNTLLERVFNSNFDLIALTDLQGTFTLVSKTHEVLGYHSSYLLGKNVMDFVHPDDISPVTEEFSKFLQSGENRKVEYRYKRIDSRYLWFETIGTILKDQHGIPEQILFNTRNITDRKQAEKEIKESEERFKALHNASFSGIAIHDKGVILECNQGLSDMTGYSREELIGMDGLLLIAPQSRDMVMGNILAGYEKPYEADGLRKNGEIFPMRLEARNVPYLGKEVRTVEFRDITELKQAEQKFESYVTNSPTPIFITNNKGDYTFVNPAACRLIGYTQEELLSMNIEDAAHPDKKEENLQNFPQLLEGKHIRQDISLLHKDDSKVDVILDALMLDKDNIIAFCTEITERRQMERELSEKTAFLSTLMETSPVGIVTVDRTGGITYANKRAEQILGLVRDEITARTYDAPLWNHTDLDGSPLPDEKQPFNIVKRTGETAFNVRHGITWPDGTVVILSINATPLKDTQGNFDGMLATIEDITENRKYEATIVKQLKEKETLLKEVHHRIKNSVSQIESLLSIQAASADNINVKQALQKAVSRVQGIRVLYEKLLMSKEYQYVSVKEYIESLITSLLTVFPESRDITIEKQITDFQITSKQLIPVGIIVNELMTNVFKYAFTTKKDNRIFIKLTRKGNQAILTIQDNGIGFDKRILKNRTPGFGITLVKMLAEQLGGTFTAEHNNGTQSVLKFEL